MFRTRSAVKARRRPRAPFKPSSVQDLEQRSSASSWALGMAALPFAVGAAMPWAPEARADEAGDLPRGRGAEGDDRPLPATQGGPDLRVYAGEAEQPIAIGQTAAAGSGWGISAPAWPGSSSGVASFVPGARSEGNALGGGGGSAALGFGPPLLAMAPRQLGIAPAAFDGSASAGIGVAPPARAQAPAWPSSDQVTVIPDEEAPAPAATGADPDLPMPPTTQGVGNYWSGGPEREAALPDSASGMLMADDDLPRVFISVLNSEAWEVGNTINDKGLPATVRFGRTGGDMGELELGFYVGGTAYPTAYGMGTDYEFEGRVGPGPLSDFAAVFMPGESFVDVKIVPLGDNEVEGDETAIITLVPYEINYVISGQSEATVTIHDDDSPNIGVTPRDDSPGAPLTCGCLVAVDPNTGRAQVAVANAGRPNCGADKLVYATGSNTDPIFDITYRPEAGGNLPGSIRAEVSINGSPAADVYFGAGGGPSTDGVAFSLQVPAGSITSSGSYSYSIKITGQYPSTTYTKTITGSVFIVKAAAPATGGWQFSNIDRLYIDGGVAFLLHPDGSTTRFFSDVGGYITTDDSFLTMAVSGGAGTVTDRYGNRDVFDTDGRLVRRLDRIGNITTYTYVDGDGDGKARELSTITDPFNRVATYTYSGGKLVSSIDFAGRVTSYTYDGSGHLQSIIQPDPDGPGPLTSPTSSMSYDGSGRLSSVNNPGLRLVTLTYDDSGGIASLLNTGAGTQGFTIPFTTTTWHSGSSSGTIISPAPVAPPQRIAVMADALNRITTMHLDRQGRVVKEIDPLGQVTEYTRDNKGLVLELKRPDPDGAGPLVAPVTKFSYDGKGNLLKVTYPDATTETWTYDPNFSQVTSHKDPLGRITTYTVDSGNGNTTAATDPMGRTVSYSYTSKGLLQSVTLPDPDGAGPLTASTTNYAYDSRGRLTTITNPDSTARLFAYSSADDLIAATDELGRVTTFTYDLMSRQTGVILPDPDGAGPLTSPSITYKLRSDGLVESETDALGRVTSYSYDSAGRLSGVTQPDPDGAGPLTASTTNYAYDVMGRMTTLTDALGRVTAYTFDELGRLRTVTEPGTGSPRTTYTYDPLDRLAAVTDPLGRVTSYAYDVRDRMTTMTLPNAGAGSPVWSYQYDAAGQLTGQVDPLGRTTNLAYNLAGQLTRVTGPDPDGAGPLARPIATYTYDARGRQSTGIDPLGRVTSYAYDARNRVTTVTYPDPDGAGPQASPWTAYQYDAVGNVTALRERVDASRSRVSTFVYDNLDRLIEARNPVYSDQAAATVGTQYAYDAMNNLTKVTDPLGRVTSYAYDGWDRLTTLTLPNPGSGSPVVKYAYDAVSNLLATTDPNGQVTSYAYDARDQLTTVTYPNPGSGSPVAKYEYDLAGNLTKATDPLGRATSYAYDALNRLTTVTRPDGGDGNPVTKYGYDLVGNLTNVTDALGRVTSYAYDGLDRLTTLTQPSPAVGQPVPTSKYEYDAAGNLTRAIDPNGNERRWAYDNLDRLATETLAHAAGQSATAPKVVLQYDSLGRRTALTDPMSNTTTWVYDARDLVTQEIDPRNKSTTYVYDDAGQLTQKVDRNVRRTDYAYDALGRMTTETWYSGATPIRSVVQSYDKLSRLTGVADPAATLTFAYDNLSRLTTATTSGTATGQPNVTLAYGYDAAGNRTSMADNLATAGRTTYIYDALDRLGTIARAIGAATMTVAFDYDLGNRLVSTARKAGASGASITSGYAYDNLDRLTTLTHQNSTTPPGTSLASYAYGYDAGGRLTKEVDHRGTATYTYDPQGQLTGIDRPGTAQDRTLTFDANGNRTMSGYSTGTGNRLGSGEGYTYTYDDEGNLTGKVQTATGEVTSYTYDHRNRLTHVERRSSTNVVLAVADYVYDGLDRRIETVIDADGANPNPAVTTWTVYDGLDAYADFNASGTLQTRYLFGPGVDNLLARTSAAGTTDWYLTDRLGSVREIVGGAGTVSYTADYDAFGVREATTGAGGDRWGFTGRETDAASGLQYNRARYYDPATSRWISQDPIGFAAGDQNLYRYVGNGPTNDTDSSGLFYGDDEQPQPTRQRNGSRRQKLGENARLDSPTGRAVIARMRAEKKIVGEGADTRVLASTGEWVPLDKTELSHIRDGVYYWNEEGKYHGARSGPVRGWMLDPNNYVLDLIGKNRSAGAKLRNMGVRYDPEAVGQRPPSDLSKCAPTTPAAPMAPDVALKPDRPPMEKIRGGTARGKMAKGLAALDVYLTFRDAAEATGLINTEVQIDANYFFTDDNGSIFYVYPGNLIWSPSRNFVTGPRAGQTEYITSKDVRDYQELGDSIWGRLEKSWFGSKRFIPGTHRSRLPVLLDGYEVGYYDSDGYHDNTFADTIRRCRPI